MKKQINFYNLLEFLKELRDSADIIYKIFTEGSCFRLYSILKCIYPQAIPYWSDRDNHCIIEIQERFFDIGGEVSSEYIKNRDYHIIDESKFEGYKLLKFSGNKEHEFSVIIEKYIL